MDKYQTIWTILTSVISALVVVAGWIFTVGKKFQVLDDLKEKIDKIDDSVGRMTDKLGGLGERISKIEGKIFGVAISTSPISLTPLGQELVQHSGILDMLKPKKDGLIQTVKKKNPQTAYDVQEFVRNLFSAEGLSLTEEELNKLKDHAFSKGVGLNDILYAASIYFRDVALGELKFKPEDLDSKNS